MSIWTKTFELVIRSLAVLLSSLFVKMWHLMGGSGEKLLAAWFQIFSGSATTSYVNVASAFCTVNFHLPIFERDIKLSTSTACRSLHNLIHSSLTTDQQILWKFTKEASYLTKLPLIHDPYPLSQIDASLPLTSATNLEGIAPPFMQPPQ